MAEIYYIEDDENIARIVKDFLEKKKYSVAILPTISEAKQALKKQVPTLVLVDWNMPDGRGDTLCQWIRSQWKDLPIIFVTVRSDSGDIVSGFRNGADDYVIKPFDLEVLYSRILALLRRAGDVSKEYLSCDRISINCKQTTTFIDSEEIMLSPQEYQLLLFLMQNKGKTITREILLKHIWDDNGNYVNDNTLTVTMKRLREKLHQPACLKTVRSIGYRMEEVE